MSAPDCKQCDGTISARGYVRFVAEQFIKDGQYPEAASLVATDAGVFCDRDCLAAYLSGVNPEASLANRLEYEAMVAAAAQADREEPF